MVRAPTDHNTQQSESVVESQVMKYWIWNKLRHMNHTGIEGNGYRIGMQRANANAQKGCCARMQPYGQGRWASTDVWLSQLVLIHLIRCTNCQYMLKDADDDNIVAERGSWTDTRGRQLNCTEQYMEIHRAHWNLWGGVWKEWKDEGKL